VWEGRTQVQRVSTIEADKEGGACGNATKGATREEASTSYQGKGVGKRKEAEKSRGR